MSRLTRSALPAFIALIAAALPIATSQAAAGADSIRMRHSDLNLSTVAGVAVLYDRIRTAAADYRAPARLLTGTRVSPGYARCVKDSLETTVKQIGHPAPSAPHASRSATSPRLNDRAVRPNHRLRAFRPRRRIVEHHGNPPACGVSKSVQSSTSCKTRR